MSDITESDGSAGSTVTAPGTIHHFYDPTEDDAVGYTIVTAVAAARQADHVDLPPLYDAVDVDALGALVDGACDRPDTVAGRVTFAYAGFDITVDFNGVIRLDPVDGSTLHSASTGSDLGSPRE